MTVAKIALLAFIAFAIIAVAVIIARRRRQAGPTRYQRREDTVMGQMYGAMPATPVPDWVYDDERFGDPHQDPPAR